MIVQILSHTPIWVYALFFVLLMFGLIQTRTRIVRKMPALLLPAGMLALSLWGIYSSFGLATILLAAWGMAIAIASVVGYTFSGIRGFTARQRTATSSSLAAGVRSSS